MKARQLIDDAERFPPNVPVHVKVIKLGKSKADPESEVALIARSQQLIRDESAVKLGTLTRRDDLMKVGNGFKLTADQLHVDDPIDDPVWGGDFDYVTGHPPLLRSISRDEWWSYYFVVPISQKERVSLTLR